MHAQPGQSPTCPNCGFDGSSAPQEPGEAATRPAAADPPPGTQAAAGASVPEQSQPEASSDPEDAPPSGQPAGTGEADEPASEALTAQDQEAAPGPEPSGTDEQAGGNGRGPMRELKCPNCATTVRFAPGETPTCPGCGFSAPPPGDPAPASGQQGGGPPPQGGQGGQPAGGNPPAGGPPPSHQQGPGPADQTHPSSGPAGSQLQAQQLSHRAPQQGQYGAQPPGSGSGFGPLAIFGVVMIALSITGLIVANTAPWFSANDQSLDKDQAESFLSGPSGYGESLISWTTMGLIGSLVVGVVLVGIDLAPMPSPMDGLLTMLATGAGTVFALLLTLAAFRMLGYYIARLLDSGDTMFHLHAVPYTTLVVGTVMLVGMARYLRDAVTEAGPPQFATLPPAATSLATWALVISMIGLLASPLLPYANVSSGQDTFQLGEGALAGLAEQDNTDAGDAAGEIELARTMLWITLWGSLATLFFVGVDRTGLGGRIPGLLAQVFLLTAVPVVLGLIFAMMGYIGLFGSDVLGTEVGVGFSYALPIALVAMGILVIRFVTSVTLPYYRASQAQRGQYPS